MQYDEVDRGWRDRLSAALDRAEYVYLRILRAVILIIATLLIAYAAWLAISALYKMSRSPDSVIEATATVSADEITNAEMPDPKAQQASNAAPMATPDQQQFYADYVNRYYDLFRTRFEPFRQAEDKQLTKDEFDDNYVGSRDRMEAVAKGDLDFDSDKADLESLFIVMNEAAGRPATQQRLSKYRSARKVQVAKKVQRTRMEYRRGWDTYSTACVDWYQSPVGCPVQRAVQVPFTETVLVMEFPEGTQSHTNIFRAFQDRYFKLLDDRRDANVRKAEAERQDIIAGKVEGGVSLMTAFQVVLAFLMLMFFFLLIAIERHQRKMSQQLESV